MTTQEKLIHRKLNLLDLAEYLQNVSEACRVMGVSRQHFYDIKQAFAEGGIEALRDKNRRKPNFRNRAPAHVEQAVCEFALEQPAYGQVRAANQLRKRGIEVSAAGVRCIWLRYDLERRGKRLKALEAKAAAEGLVYTEAQLAALAAAKRERESEPESIDTEHPGYLLAQDTMYVGRLKGVRYVSQEDLHEARGVAEGSRHLGRAVQQRSQPPGETLSGTNAHADLPGQQANGPGENDRLSHA